MKANAKLRKLIDLNIFFFSLKKKISRKLGNLDLEVFKVNFFLA